MNLRPLIHILTALGIVLCFSTMAPCHAQAQSTPAQTGQAPAAATQPSQTPEYDWNASIARWKKDYERDKAIPGDLAAFDLFHIGLEYSFLDQFETSNQYYEQALPVYKKSPYDQWLVAETLDFMAQNYDKLGQYAKAIGYYKQAIQIDKPENDPNVEAGRVYAIAKIYYAQRQYDKAAVYYKQAQALEVEISKKMVDMPPGGNPDFGLGNCCFYTGRYQRAHDYYENALLFYTRLGEQAGVADARHGIALCAPHLDGAD